MNGAPKIAANATAIRLCSSSTAGVGAGLLLGQRSDSDVRLQAAANRGASKHFDDARNRGIVGRPMRPSPRYTVVDHRTMRTFGEKEGVPTGQRESSLLPLGSNGTGHGHRWAELNACAI